MSVFSTNHNMSFKKILKSNGPRIELSDDEDENRIRDHSQITCALRRREGGQGKTVHML